MWATLDLYIISTFPPDVEYEPAPCSESDVFAYDGTCRSVRCGGTLYAMTGVLHPPNWPNSSSNRMLCEWAIVLPDPERRVRIVVDDIDMRGGFGCFWNYVMVFDTSAAQAIIPPLLGSKMCGTTPPSEDLIATGNVVNIMYQSQDPPNRGFAFSFFAV